MKVLIFSASTGGGHKRAAAALKDYFETASPQIEVKIMDGIALTGSAYNRFICGGYTILAKKAPRFYGHIYKSSNKKSGLNSLCNDVNRTMGKRLLPAIEEYKPDVIIVCHPFINAMLGGLKTTGKISVPIVSLLTDFAPHYTYIAKGIDHYVVSNRKMAEELKTKYNIDSCAVHSFGIPVFRKFAETPDKAQLKERLKLKPDVKTILFMAGSFGVSEILKIYKDIEKKSQDCQFVVITGNNPKLYNKFKSVVNGSTQLFMYINNVEDYMHCADLIITKPGGLTVSESLQCSLPMAVYSAFPGQEADNADFLTENGAAILLEKHPGDDVNKLIHDDERLREMSENCHKIHLEDTCLNILNLVISLTE